MSAESLAIEVDDLTVAYGENPVLWDVDVAVPSGVLMAIVGPNGAGKSTLIKGILGLVRPAAGQVLIHGRPYSEQRRLTAYVPQRGSVDWDFPTNALDVVLMGRYGQLSLFGRPRARDRWRHRPRSGAGACRRTPACWSPATRPGQSARYCRRW